MPLAPDPHLPPTLLPSVAPVADTPPASDTEPKSVAAPGGLPADLPSIPGYAITGEIARGGMGRVLAGRELALDREVAIKTLLPGANPARFVTESKITAKLPHPNIPPVHALGTLADGSPFLAMKRIHGRTLAAELGDRETPAAELPRFVQIFEQVAQAVGFAHSRGVVHRDLKPLNVMVGEFGEVQVMDWGLAREVRNADAGTEPDPVAPASEPVSAHTRAGAVMGTPAYMAPEQARGEPADERADVFALGVTLMEVLTGERPWGDGPAAVVQARAARALLTDCHETLAVCPADTELVAIARKCLSADPADRYPDGRAVTDAVADYRAGVEQRLRQAETDRARAETQAAEQRKRRKAMTWAGGIIVGVLVAGVVGTAIGLVKARRQTEYAEEQEGIAKAETAKKESALLAETAAKVEERQANTDLWTGLDALTANIVGDTLGTQKVVSNEQKKFLETVLPLYRQLAAKKGNDRDTRERVARAAHRIGTIESRVGRDAVATAAYEQARVTFEGLAEESPTLEHRRGLADAQSNLGTVKYQLGDFTGAEKEFRAAVRVGEQLLADFPNRVHSRVSLAGSYMNLGLLLVQLGRGREAEAAYRAAIRLAEETSTGQPAAPAPRVVVAGGHGNLAVLLTRSGREAAAVDEHRKALAVWEKLAADFPTEPEHRAGIANCRTALADAVGRQGKPTEAEAEYRLARAILDKLTTEYPAVPHYRELSAKCHTNRGLLLVDSAKGADAEADYRIAIAIWTRLAAEFPGVPDYRDGLAASRLNLGALLVGHQKASDAEEHYLAALAAWDALVAEFPAVPTYRHRLASARINAANVYRTQRRTADAEREFRRAIDAFGKLTAEHPDIPDYRQSQGLAHNNLASLLRALGEAAKAEREYRAALAIRAKLAADSPGVPSYRADLADGHGNLAGLLKESNRRAEAEAAFRDGLAVWVRLATEFPDVREYRTNVGRYHYCLGELALEGDKYADSLASFDSGIEALSALYQADPLDATVNIYLRDSTLNRALARHRLGRYADAVRDWDRALEVSASNVRASIRAPRTLSLLHAGRAADAVAEVNDLCGGNIKWPASEWYNFACICSVASVKLPARAAELMDRAMELLRLAARAGYTNHAHMRTDSDLDPLRDRGDFKRLLADLEAKLPTRQVAPPPRPAK